MGGSYGVLPGWSTQRWSNSSSMGHVAMSHWFYSGCCLTWRNGFNVSHVLVLLRYTDPSPEHLWLVLSIAGQLSTRPRASVRLLSGAYCKDGLLCLHGWLSVRRSAFLKVQSCKASSFSTIQPTSLKGGMEHFWLGQYWQSRFCAISLPGKSFLRWRFWVASSMLLSSLFSSLYWSRCPLGAHRTSSSPRLLLA